MTTGIDLGITTGSPSARPQVQFVRAHDGARLACARTGQGPLLIRPAAWIGAIEHDGRNPVLAPLQAALGSRHQVLRYDDRGCGLSDPLQPADLFDSWVRDLEAIADGCGDSRFALLGIAQGAAVAIAYAARHPERVSRLVLHGAYARGRRVRDRSGAAAAEADTLVRLAELGWDRRDESFRQFFTSQIMPDGTREQHARFNEIQGLATSAAKAAAWMRACDRIDVSDRLGSVRCPTLVLHSRHDRCVPFEEGRFLASGIADAELVPLTSPNHLLLDSEPEWPRWLSRVQQFLAADTARSDAAGGCAALTGRQRDLVELLAQGRDNSRIALQLGLSEKTVRNHITSIFAKLGVEHRGQAIVRAREAGFGAPRH